MGWLVGIFAGLTFWLWFKIKGISFMKPKRFAAFGTASLIEMIPIPLVASLPAWTAAVLYLALDSKLKSVIAAVPGGNLATNAMSGNKKTPIDVSRGTQEAQNLEAGRMRNRPIDVSRGAQEARNLERSRNNRPIDINAQKNSEKIDNQGIPSANQPNTPSNSKNNGKTNSMSVHDELWELNSKSNLDNVDKERLQRAHWIWEHNHIEDKEKSDPVLLRAWERANRGEVISDGSPEKRHGFVFSNVRVVNATNTIAGRDFDSLNPQYGNNRKK